MREAKERAGRGRTNPRDNAFELGARNNADVGEKPGKEVGVEP